MAGGAEPISAPLALPPTWWQDTGPELPLCPQDTTDYVAYVAKDPINQRGDAGPCAQELWGRGGWG